MVLGYLEQTPKGMCEGLGLIVLYVCHRQHANAIGVLSGRVFCQLLKCINQDLQSRCQLVCATLEAELKVEEVGQCTCI